MSLPNNSFSPVGTISTWLPPDDITRFSLEDYELGGIALSDPSQGLQVQNWKAWVDGTTIKIAPIPYTSSVTLITGLGTVTEISLAFDQNMRPSIAYIVDGNARLYWYDPVLGSATITSLPAGIVSLFLSMDDKRPAATILNTNDILLFYVNSGVLYYRQQRDRYNIERSLALLRAPTAKLRKAGMGRSWRLQVQVAY